MHRHFHDPQQEDNYENLTALEQGGNVDEYRTQFELYSVPLKEALEGMQTRALHNGLKEEVRAELIMVRGQGLLDVMDQALKIEA